jgi:glucose-1-phosphate thymidylyltransferase
VWFDVGTPNSLLSASSYVEVIQSRQGVSIASPEEIAWRMKLIDTDKFNKLISAMPECQYKKMLNKTFKLN